MIDACSRMLIAKSEQDAFRRAVVNQRISNHSDDRIYAMPLTFYKKPALVVYVTCGDPDLATTREIVLAAIEAGADVIELGVPFSDPVADGPVIQRASERALKHGTSLAQVLTLAAEVRQHAQSTGLIVFSYLNPILRMGMEKFCKVARAAGVDGVLVTDLAGGRGGRIFAGDAGV